MPSSDQNDVGSGGGRAALKIDLNDNWTITPQLIAQTQKTTGDFARRQAVGGDLNVANYFTPYNNDTLVQAR